MSLEDIQERVDIMQKELDLEISGTVAADTSNLMRLIQGTVMPQVTDYSHTHLCIPSTKRLTRTGVRIVIASV